VKVVRVVSAFECGAIVNPDNLRNQIEGSNIQGLGGALFEAIEFENGKILNGRMSEYRVPRFSDVPVLETVLLDREDLPSAGAGDCPWSGWLRQSPMPFLMRAMCGCARCLWFRTV
jgi:nicotinate dehydrogenase subunit B